MREINCNIIRDILPLYADDAVCEDTRQLVDEHLERCDDCRRELEVMRRTMVLPMDTETKPLKQMKKRLERGKRRTAALSALCTALALLTVGLFLILYCTPASSDTIKVTTEPSETGYWQFNLAAQDGMYLKVKRTVLQASEEEGDTYRMDVYETPFPLAASEFCRVLFGRYWETEPPEDYDVNVLLVFNDQEVTYSMRELGQEYWNNLEEIREG